MAGAVGDMAGAVGASVGGPLAGIVGYWSRASTHSEHDEADAGLLAGWEGWEQGMTPGGRVFYIDHNTHTTHWKA